MMREYVHYRNWQGLYIRVFSSPGKTDCSTCRSILRFEPLLPTPCSSGCTVCPYLPCLAHCLPPRREHRMALPRCASAFSSVPRSLQPRRPGRNGTCVEWNMLSGVVPVTVATPALGCSWCSVAGDALLWRCSCFLLPWQVWQTLALIIYF